MSLGSIYVAKELESSYKPLFLCEFTFRDGSVYRVSTAPLTAGYGGSPAAGSYQYGGHAWEPRVLNQDIGPTQAMSDLGVDIVPNVTIVFADPDKSVFSLELDKGFKGATLRLYSIMWDAGNSATGAFTSDLPAPIKFIGSCSAATAEEKTLTVVAVNLLNMSQSQMPPIRVQPTCPWTFPPNAEARSAAVSIPGESIFGECGYGPDQPGGVGNYESGTAAFTSCAYTFEDCVARLGNSGALVQINQDQSDRRTGNFGGFRWIPEQSSGRQRPYTTSKWEEIINASNEARYGDYVPLVYGTCWVDPLVMGIWGDGNYTNMEVLVSYGKISKIKKLLVNGYEIPRLFDDSVSGYRTIDDAIPTDNTVVNFKNGFWKTINNGNRHGLANPEPGWGKKGDPYGSYCAIYISVLRDVAKEGEIPKIQVLVEGQHLRQYSDEDTYTVGYTNNNAWVLLDVLTWCGWKYSEIDVSSFVTAAAKCAYQMNFVRMDGTYTNVFLESGLPAYSRFSTGFCLRQRRPGPEIVRGLRNAMRAMLYFDYTTGKLKIVVKETLAEQQSSPIVGSNYNDPVPSILADGSEQDGYVAYKFDGSNIIRTNDGSSTVSVTQRGNQDSPNKVTVPLNNRENGYNPDSATITDVEDIERLNNEVVGSFPLEGVQTFDHAYRLARTWFSENYRGNPRLDYLGSDIGDTGGTIEVEFKTTVKASHIGIGQLCLFSDVQHGITNQLMRVRRVHWSMDGEIATLLLSWHNDNWYRDTFGQVNQPLYIRGRSIVDRAPFAWRPDFETPIDGDALFDPTNKGFGIQQEASRDGDGTSRVYLKISGKIPVNKFPNEPGKPRLELIGQGVGGGGYEEGETFFAALAAKDRTGTAYLLSPLSAPVTIRLDSGETGLSFVPQRWFDNPSGYVAFAGLDPFAMTYQFDADEVPSAAISLTNSYNEASWGPPDEAFNNLLFNVRYGQHLGIWGQQLLAAGANWLKISTYDNYGFETDSLVGREVSVLALRALDTRSAALVPIANFPIASNSDNELFLSAGDPSTAAQGESLDAGDVVVLRFDFTHGEDSEGIYLEDALAINPLNPITGPFVIDDATNTSPITITLRLRDDEVMPIESGQTVVVYGVRGNDGANGGFVAGTVDETARTVELLDSAGTGDYTYGGLCGRQFRGFNVDEEVGRIAYIISGKGVGTFVKIKSNTSTRLYVDGTWPIAPDSTSRIVILDSVISQQIPSNKMANTVPQLVGQYPIDVTQHKGKTLFIEGKTQSHNGAQSPDPLSTVREVFVYDALDAPKYDFAIVFSQDGNLEVETDATAPYIYVREVGKPVLCSVWAIELPTDNDSILAMPKLNGVDLLISPIALSPSATAPVFVDNFAYPIPIFRFNDVITVDILQVGENIPGSKFTLEIYVKAFENDMDLQVDSIIPGAILDFSDESDLGTMVGVL